MGDNPGDTGGPAPGRGVYGISVAAELSGIPMQSLRLYERYGLLTPDRSDGGTRRYSADDLARLQRISALVGAGINLAGIARILGLEDDNTALRRPTPTCGRATARCGTRQRPQGRRRPMTRGM